MFHVKQWRTGAYNETTGNNNAGNQYPNQHNAGICKILRIHESAINIRNDRPRTSRPTDKPVAHLRRQIYFYRPIKGHYEHLRTNNKAKKHNRQNKTNLRRILERRNQKRMANRSIPLGTGQRRNSRTSANAKHDRQQRPGIDQIIIGKNYDHRTIDRSKNSNR